MKSILMLLGVIIISFIPQSSQAQGLIECAVLEVPRETGVQLCETLAMTQELNVVICPENGGDCLGTSQNDCIVGSDFMDIIDAGKGDDLVFGFEGNDLIIGGQDGDFLLGGNGEDVIEGGWGEDTICGGQNDDVIDGGRCDDRLTGGISIPGQPAENDTCLGGKGLDSFQFCASEEQGPDETEDAPRCNSQDED